MSDQESSYLSYLLRLWRVNEAGKSAWHASLEDIHTGRRLGFADLASLFAFLERRVGSDMDREEQSPQ